MMVVVRVQEQLHTIDERSTLEKSTSRPIEVAYSVRSSFVHQDGSLVRFTGKHIRWECCEHLPVLVRRIVHIDLALFINLDLLHGTRPGLLAVELEDFLQESNGSDNLLAPVVGLSHGLMGYALVSELTVLTAVVSRVDQGFFAAGAGVRGGGGAVGTGRGGDGRCHGDEVLARWQWTVLVALALMVRFGDDVVSRRWCCKSPCDGVCWMAAFGESICSAVMQMPSIVVVKTGR